VSISWDTANAGSVDRQLNIYDGANESAALLHSQVIPFASIVNGVNHFVIDASVAINFEEVNFVEISLVGGGSGSGAADGVMFGDDVYPEGVPRWGRTGGFDDLDLAAEVTIAGGGLPVPEEVEIPVPASSWLSLFIMSLLLVFAGFMAIQFRGRNNS
jgi:hypothetical protein